VACPASAPCQQTQIDSQDATDAWQVHMQESGASRIWWMVKRMCCPIQCVLSEAGKVAEQELFTILQATKQEGQLVMKKHMLQQTSCAMADADVQPVGAWNEM
jgi:hypothetical protein